MLFRRDHCMLCIGNCLMLFQSDLLDVVPKGSYNTKMRTLSLLFAVLLIPSISFSQSLAERQKAFHAALNKEKTPEGQIKKAQTIAQDKKSKFRVDAINYLIDQKSMSSGPMMVHLAKDPAVREFALYGIGELGVYEATPLLIRYMRDDNRNNRGNAYRALQKLYPREFNVEFHHDDPEYTREKIVKDVESWWRANRDRLKNRTMEQKTDKEKQEAEERWEKYGKDYLERPVN